MALSGVRHNWKIIQQHIENYTKIKYTIALLYDFLYRFKSHMYFHKNTMGMDKFEYMSIIQNISHIQNELNCIKQILSQQKVYIFTYSKNISKFIEVYTSILYLIEKYGSSNIINTINYYLLLYCEIVNLYHLYKNANPITKTRHQSNSKQKNNLSDNPIRSQINPIIKTQFTSLKEKLSERLLSSLPNKNGDYMSYNSKMACITSIRNNAQYTHDENNILSSTDYSSTEEYNTDEDDIFNFDIQHKIWKNKLDNAITSEFNTIPNGRGIRKTTYGAQNVSTTEFGFDNPIYNESLQPILNMYHTWFLKVSKQKYINSFNTLNGTLLRNIYRPNRNINNQYLDLMTNCIKPFEMNIFLKQGINQGGNHNNGNDNCIIHDLFEQLTQILEKQELCKSQNHLCHINHGISKIYKYIIQKIENLSLQNINFSNIQNTNILATINNYEYIKDNILHVFICIPITKHNKLIFVINGYIENQDVMISQKYSITAQKYDIISKQISSIEDLSMSFKKMFLKTLTLKQLLCVSNNDIIKCCYDKWTQYTTLMAQSIIDMITYFLNGDTRKKIEILSCLLYNHKNAEAVFRVQMLWNLIIDESNVIKQRLDSTEREIVNRMHPELLIHLNNMTSYEYNKITEDEICNLTGGNEQTTYEKRIAQSNTDTTTKQKMLDKLKELSNKNSDNNSKAQQYLDGILNIPFGKVAKEAIICENDNYTHAVNQYMSNLVILCLDFKDTYSACNDLLILLVEMHGLEIHMLLSFTNEIDTETYILSRLANRKIKTAMLTAILDVCNKFIQSKLTISSDTIDTLYLITFLKELNIDEQCDICQLYNINYSSHTVTDFAINNTAPPTFNFKPTSPFCSPFSLLGEAKTQKENLLCSEEHIGMQSQLKMCQDKKISEHKPRVKKDPVVNEYAQRHAGSTDVKPEQKEKENDVEVVGLHRAGNSMPVQTVDTNVTFDKIIHILESVSEDTHSYRQLKADIISILTNESYFYDTGIPLEIIRYKEKLVGLLSKNKELTAKKKEYLTNCYKQLDKSIHGQPDAKDQIIRIMGQWLNGNQSGYCIGFEGAPGVGKTSLAKYGIANALLDNSGKGRPFGFIALGGSSNGSTLEGHSYTYVGSTWGRIVDIIMTAGVMNPIIFIDELDKISTTESGRELIGILTHITDKTQNMEFMDKYFADVKIDLSQVLFVFSYNDYSKLDSILADRIHRIKFDNYSVTDKITICNNYLVPKIQDEINVNDFECVISPHTLRYIIESYTYEAGVRKLKEKLYDILREINVKYIKGEITCGDITYNNGNDTNCAQINITPDLVDTILNSYYKVEIPRPMDTPFVGVVYGLYATAMCTGGITIIQVTKKYTDSAPLLCTGKPGDVMLESMKVSLTLAINILAPEILTKWGINHSGDAGKFGLHIHCPDGATPKDGPSAGCAFTVALFSLLTDTPVLNTVSMTGEIDIMGNVLPIGGLDSKIQGSTRSGIYNILVPIDNKKDVIHIQRRQPEILEGVNIIYTKTVHDVLKHSLVTPTYGLLI